jgi:hypothetical protein
MRRIHVEHRLTVSPVQSANDVANDFVRSFGWRPPKEWTPIDREGAIETLSTALMNDLVDDAPRMPFREAEERAREFVAQCAGDAIFFTNGALDQARMGFGRRPITSAKADAGVIAVSSTEVRMMWIEDYFATL